MSDQPIRCCEHLSSKRMHFDPDERPGRLREDDSIDYTCLQTMSPVGPDEKDARPELCQSGRSCFKGDDG